MAVRALSSTSVTLAVGAVWLLDVEVTDAVGQPEADAPAVVITLPDGGTANPPVTGGPGIWAATYTVGASGRHVARVVSAGGGAVDFTAWVDAIVTAADMPDIAALDEFLRETEPHSWSDDALQEALDSEAANQRRVCRIPAAYTDDLRSALLRRAQRHLALRVPRPEASDEAGSPQATRQYGRDAEIKRLEAPYRRLVKG